MAFIKAPNIAYDMIIKENGTSLSLYLLQIINKHFNKYEQHLSREFRKQSMKIREHVPHLLPPFSVQKKLM